jgi:hypothetical protein
MIAVNLDGTFHRIQAALPGMWSPAGRIVALPVPLELLDGYVPRIAPPNAMWDNALGAGTSPRACPLTRYVRLQRNGHAEREPSPTSRQTGRTPEQARADLAARNPQTADRRRKWRTPLSAVCLPASEAITGKP